MSGCCTEFVPGSTSTGGGGSTPTTDQVFQYTVLGTEPDLDNLVIALPAARANTNYAVFPAQEQFAFLLSMGVLTASKTVAQFVLSLSADATAGDVFNFLVKDL